MENKYLVNCWLAMNDGKNKRKIKDVFKVVPRDKSWLTKEELKKSSRERFIDHLNPWGSTEQEAMEKQELDQINKELKTLKKGKGIIDLLCDMHKIEDNKVVNEASIEYNLKDVVKGKCPTFKKFEEYLNMQPDNTDHEIESHPSTTPIKEKPLPKHFKIEIKEEHKEGFREWVNTAYGEDLTKGNFGYFSVAMKGVYWINCAIFFELNKPELFWNPITKKPDHKKYPDFIDTKVFDEHLASIHIPSAMGKGWEKSFTTNPMEEKEKRYRLKEYIELNYPSQNITFKQHTECRFHHKINNSNIFVIEKSIDLNNVTRYEYIPQQFVEEIPEQKLSDIVKFGDELERRCIDDREIFIYAGYCNSSKNHYCKNVKFGIMHIYNKNGLNDNFLLKTK